MENASSRNLTGRVALAILAILLSASHTLLCDVIPSDRLIPWDPGIPGGIPNRTTIYQTISAGSSQSTIQSALNSCPSGQVVKLAAGSYTLSSSLIVPSNVTLRGAGIGQTILNAGSGMVSCWAPPAMARTPLAQKV